MNYSEFPDNQYLLSVTLKGALVEYQVIRLKLLFVVSSDLGVNDTYAII
jgi:hypothetical protein